MRNIKNYILQIITGLIVGVFIPSIFIFLDLNELQMSFNTENILFIADSQYIFSFSLIFFPCIFAMMFLLIAKNRKKNKALISATKELKHAKDYLDGVVESVNELLIVITDKGVITKYNRNFLKAHKIEESYLLSNPLEETLIHNEGEIGDDIVSKVFFEKIIHNIEIYFKHEKILIPILFSSSTLASQNEAVCLIKDISNIKDLEAKLEVERSQSMQSSKLAALGEMAGGIAHEINNPLAIIDANTNYLKKLIAKNAPKKELIKRLEINHSTIDRIQVIVNALSVLSRDSSDEKFAFIKAEDLFLQILGLVQEKFKVNNVRLEVDLKSKPFQIPIELKQIQFSQILINLLNNSFDAIKDFEDKWIRIDLSERNGFITFRILDSGEGIPQEVQDNLFIPFFTTKPIGEGTGLGLSTSNSIILDHQGTISIDNKCKNTCFVIKIPLIQAKEAA